MHWVNTYQDTLKLKLTPLSKICDGDAIELSILCGLMANPRIHRFDEKITITDGSYTLQIGYLGYIHMEKNQNLYHLMMLPIYDFIRSKGYALPWMGLPIKKLVEYGWVVLQ